ncbi:MAG: hypothetical protein ACRYGF_05840 [Janthinobacterium lividum]
MPSSERAIDAETERLKQLRSQVAGNEVAVAQKAPKGMSAEERKRIAEAQKARWANQKKEAGMSAAKSSKKKERGAGGTQSDEEGSG